MWMCVDVGGLDEASEGSAKCWLVELDISESVEGCAIRDSADWVGLL